MAPTSVLRSESPSDGMSEDRLRRQQGSGTDSGSGIIIDAGSGIDEPSPRPAPLGDLTAVFVYVGKESLHPFAPRPAENISTFSEVIACVYIYIQYT